MKASALIPKCGKPVEFSRRELARVPESPGCYALSNYHGDILYVGKATSLRDRMGEHLDSPDKIAVTKLGAAFWFHYHVAEESRHKGIESGWYRLHEDAEGLPPPLNKQRPPAP